ncbi:MAG: hypothetical protein R3327_04760 [Nitrosopumilaceae archaeon]|nr:hypothetical protein [Nitrosopumilaceae archaeon]
MKTSLDKQIIPYQKEKTSYQNSELNWRDVQGLSWIIKDDW